MSKKINYPLEGLRGLCALTVAFSHVQGGQILLTKTDSYVNYLEFGHLAVLLFFVLSGYVIGISTSQNDLKIKDYLIKRIVRIYPIYLIVILFCFVIEPDINFSLVFGQLFILQGWTQTLSTNVVLWSINYELLFYILFIFCPRQFNKIALWIIVCILLSFAIWIFNSIPSLIGGYAAGFAFWLTGFLIAKTVQPIQCLPEKKINTAPIISIILTVFVYHHLMPGLVLLNGIGLQNPQRDIISVADIAALPICFLAIIEIGGIKVTNALGRIAYCVSYGIPAIILSYLFFTNRLLENTHWVVGMIAFILAVATLFFKQPIQYFDRLSFWGGISYAVYIVHYPFGYILGRALPTEDAFYKVLIFSFWLSLTISISWWLEKKYQPVVRNFLYHHFSINRLKK